MSTSRAAGGERVPSEAPDSGTPCLCGAGREEDCTPADCEADWYDDGDDDFRCPTCKGRGTVNPLTAPPDFFCVGTTDCPTCDGTGRF